MRKRLRSRVGMRLPTPARAVSPPPSANRLPPTAFAPLSANRLRAKFSDSFRRRRELRPAVMQSMKAKPDSFSSHNSPSRTSGASWPTGHRGQPGGRSNRPGQPGGRNNRASWPIGYAVRSGVAEDVIAHRLARRTESPAGRIRRPRPRCGSLSGDLCRARVDFLHNGNSGSVRITLS